MLRKVLLGSALPLIAMGHAAFAADADSGKTNKTERLIEMLEGLDKGDVDPALLEAYFENRGLPQQGTVGVWTDARHTKLDDDRPGNAKEAESTTFALGADYRLSARTLLGLAVHKQDTDTESDVSETSTAGYSKIEDDSDGVSVYGSHLFLNGIAVDGSLAYQWTDTEITDYSSIAAPSRKTTEGENLSANIGVSGLYPFTPEVWASGRASFSYVHGSQDAYTDSFGRQHDDQSYDVGTAGLEANLNYAPVDWLVPYAGLNFGYDVISDVGAPARVLNPGGSVATSVPYQDERDRFSYGFQVGVGADILPDLTVSAAYRQQHWGSDLQAQTFFANLRYTF